MREVLFRERILTDKERKNLAILGTIRRDGPITKTNVSKITNLNIVTVSNYVGNFNQQGLLYERGLDVSQGGRRPILVDIKSDAGYVIGVGLNVFDMVAVLVDLSTKVVVEVRKERPTEYEKTNTTERAQRIMDLLVELVREVLDKTDVDKSKIIGIGVGVPGVMDTQARTLRWPTPELGSSDVSIPISIRELFEEKFNIPTFVENDATVAAFGERWLSLDPEIRNMLFLYSGVGCGIIIDGQMYHGSSGIAGELSIHDPNEGKYPKGEDKSCWMGSFCHLRRWEGDLGMTSNIKKILEKGEKSSIMDMADGDVEKVNTKHVVKAAKEGDSLARKVVEGVGVNLGIKVAYLINLLNPEVIVIGGGIEEAGVVLLDMVRRTARKWAYEEAANICKIIPSQLGKNAVALGAASMVTQEYFIRI